MSEKLIRSASGIRLVNVVTMCVVIIAVNIIGAGTSSIAETQTKKDSTEVLAQVDKYQNVWNTHNATALAEFFTDDADFVMGNQPLIGDREGIRNWWQNYFNRQEPQRKLTIAVNSLRIIVPGVALINLKTTTGAKSDQGKELIARKARGTWVLLKQNDNWLITAMRGMPTEEDQIIRNIDKPAIGTEGTFAPAGPPFETPVRDEIGKGCIVEIKLPYNITGTLAGKLEIDYRILIHGSCDKHPGTFDEEWIASGSFNGTVYGKPKSGKFTYTADVEAGGDVEGKIIFGQGIEGELTVSGNLKNGKLSYSGHLN